MFEKLGQVAQDVATNVSRRQFLGRFGRAAIAAAALVGGLTTNATGGRSGPKDPVYCDPTISFGGCEGHLVGSLCRDAEGNGTCQELAGGTGRCFCYTGREKKKGIWR